MKVLFLAGLLFLCGCCRHILPVESVRRDSTRVVHEVEYRERVRDTTIYVPVPRESREASGRRDSSRLETAVALSDAWIAADGTLGHTLRNKPASLPATAQLRDTERIERRDSVIVERVRIEVPVRLPPTAWQRFWMTAGKIACGGVAALVLWFVLRHRR